jgi:hypothetical protein
MINTLDNTPGNTPGTVLFVLIHPAVCNITSLPMSPASSEAKRPAPLPQQAVGIPRFVETHSPKKNFYTRNFSTDAL